VSVGIRYLWEDFWEDNLGKELLKSHLRHIAKNKNPLHINDPEYIEGLCAKIEKESEKRRKLLIEEAKDTENYLSGITDYSNIIRALEGTFWPLRLLIISGDSGEPLTIHRMDTEDIEHIRRSSQGFEYTLEVTIFDKLRKYRILIDRGSAEPLNQFTSDDIKLIISPALLRYIKLKEYAFTSFTSDYRTITRTAEREMQILAEPQRYDDFLASVIRDIPHTSIPIEALEDPAYMRECLQAIDISRMLTLRRTSEAEEDRASTIEAIDRILWRKITRRVLDMTRAILISGAEMMNGSGYPYGLSKRDIPLEARIYTIIRAYEALCHREKDVGKVRDRLIEWNQGGYFDADIFAVFMKFLDKKSSDHPPVEHTNIWSHVTPKRREYYDDFLRNYDELWELIGKIEDAYLSFHKMPDDILLRNRVSLMMNGWQDLLVQKENSTKIIAATLHGEVPSDQIEGQPGHPDERLTWSWIQSSKQKWEELDGMSVTAFLTSGIRRALWTTKFMIRSSSSRVRYIIEKWLENPKKDLLTVRGNDLITKVMADNPYKIVDLLRRIIFSPRESISVLVAHGTPIGYILWILKNFGDKDKAVIKNISLEESAIEVCLMRWGRLIEWDLLFPFRGWKVVLSEVDSICESIFGAKFSLNMWDRIHLIHLHLRFLDYIDWKSEESPLKVEELFKRLDGGEHTKHFRSVITAVSRFE
jgi:hypothetical protein